MNNLSVSEIFLKEIQNCKFDFTNLHSSNVTIQKSPTFEGLEVRES